MTRCCMAACNREARFHEPDGPVGGWWFCSPCFDIHLALRREERQQRRKATGARSSRDLKPHGTHAAYERHRRLGEYPCPDCREAERAYQAARYARRKAS